jgi:MFS family permease
MVSKLFLIGFASTGLLGPWIGRFVDTCGRKAGTILFAILYSLGALSTRSSLLPLLLLGRIAGGIGTSLLFSAPEAWLVGEHTKQGFDGKWLGETFGWAYSGDSIVAIAAGQLASISASKQGPTGPFTLSLGFLALGSALAALRWTENVAPRAVSSDEGQKPKISDAADIILKDKRILLVGGLQALFEGAMYIFVLQWPPAIRAAILKSWPGAAVSIPYGKINIGFSVVVATYFS